MVNEIAWKRKRNRRQRVWWDGVEARLLNVPATENRWLRYCRKGCTGYGCFMYLNDEYNIYVRAETLLQSCREEWQRRGAREGVRDDGGGRAQFPKCVMNEGKPC